MDAVAVDPIAALFAAGEGRHEVEWLWNRPKVLDALRELGVL